MLFKLNATELNFKNRKQIKRLWKLYVEINATYVKSTCEFYRHMQKPKRGR